jgi:hypothetical protein
MADPKPKPKLSLVAGSDAAPVIFLDGVVAWGLNNGVVQIEVAANHLVPSENGLKTKVVVTGHLRCSLAAAAELRDMIDAALESVPGIGALSN